MCIAVVPPAAFNTGSVTDETVLPPASGNDAKYTLTGCEPSGLLWKFQLDVVVTSSLPTAGAFAYQSAMLRLNIWLLPSV